MVSNEFVRFSAAAEVVASKSEEKDDGEEEEEEIEVESEDEIDTTLPINANEKTLIKR